MDKKSYLIIGGTILIFVVAITTILLLGNNQDDWTKDILNANSYQITMIDCNGRQKTLENETLNTLKDKWNELSNNGPWTGNTNECYTTVTISYDTNGIVREKQILIIDDSSIVLDLQTSTIYYTNASEVINHLNSLFIK